MAKRADVKNGGKRGGSSTNKKSDIVEEFPKEPKFGPMPLLPNHRLWTRGVMFLGVMTVVYFSSGKPKEITLAKQTFHTGHVGQHVSCSESYKTEISKFQGCSPERCGRVITDDIVLEREAKALLALAKRGMALGGSDGGATILDLHSGALTKKSNFINFYSLPMGPGIYSQDDYTFFQAIRLKIHHAVAHYFGVDIDVLHLTHPAFFARLNSKEPMMDNDLYWLPHVDKETYDSFHYTSLIYLSDYGVDFQGGRLVFIDVDNTNRTIEPRFGRVVMFTSGSENEHYVERVTSGERFAMTVSFTCNTAYAIDDPVPRLAPRPT